MPLSHNGYHFMTISCHTCGGVFRAYHRVMPPKFNFHCMYCGYEGVSITQENNEQDWIDALATNYNVSAQTVKDLLEAAESAGLSFTKLLEAAKLNNEGVEA